MAYKNSIAQEILNFLRTYKVSAESIDFGDNYYYGLDPADLGVNNLPAIIVQTKGQTVETNATATDLGIHTIHIFVVVDKRSEFNKNPEERVLQRSLENLVAGLDSTTGTYFTGSVVGILRKYLTLGSRIVHNEIPEIEYLDIGNEENKRGIAHIVFTAHERVVVINRQ